MKIPDEAKKVFGGVLFDVYQWPQEMYDGTVQTFEMISRKASVDVIAIVGDKIVILEQEQPTKSLYLSLPGGRIEEGQTAEEAARAELLQETGCVTDKMELMAEFFGVSKFYIPESIFIARDCHKTTEQNLDGGEKIKVTYTDFDGFLQLVRNETFMAPLGLRFMMYEALLDAKKKEEMRKNIFDRK